MRSIRVVTLNLWNDRPQMSARLEVAIEGLRALKPDVVALQEVMDDSDDGPGQGRRIADALEADFRFDPVEDRKGRMQGNAVVSRYPIRRSSSVALPAANGDPRRALHCDIDTPAGVLPFFTTHLAWEMWVAPVREAQVVALDEFVKANPAELPPILCGDFNDAPDSSSIRFLTGRTSLHGRGTYYRDCWARRHPNNPGHTWSAKNKYTVRWIERNRRLDYVFVGPIRDDGWGAVLDCRVVLDMPGPDGIFASDHFGVYAEIGVAPLEEAV